ncbi:glutaredoxin-like protein NrdH [uncultured Limosilactobacillus sp.]|uniref:glutaredoxin-like protein NrdH n=1 Tax=uncultured Limosilactobacillus sp. TaxID=2837629 RepID=UPI0025EBBCA6|nr:glutaredoxin-like protein NrdH [uncultured Limosilactobacillus sp.]
MIRVFTKPGCPQCKMTTNFLINHHIKFINLDITKHSQYRQSLINQGFQRVPVVMINESEKWSGFQPDRLKKLDQQRHMGMAR